LAPPRLADVLPGTPIGRALLAFWRDLPLWVACNLALGVAVAPPVVAALGGQLALAPALSFPAVALVAGVAEAAAIAAEGGAPRLAHLARGASPVALSVWAALALVAGSFLLNAPALVVALQCAVAVVALMLAPFALCLPPLTTRRPALVWRNALVLAVRAPWVALGLLALATLVGWAVALSRGALLVALPSLWVVVAVFSTRDLARAAGPRPHP
jgi:hypothetical protein